jgi:hypothetical protein
MYSWMQSSVFVVSCRQHIESRLKPCMLPATKILLRVNCITVNPVYCHLWFDWKPPRWYKWPTYRNHVSLWNWDSTTVACADVHTVHSVDRRWSWKAGTYMTLSVNKYKNGSLSTREFQSFVRVFLLMNEDFGPCTVWHRKYTAPYVGQLREGLIYVYNVALNTKLWPR